MAIECQLGVLCHGGHMNETYPRDDATTSTSGVELNIDIKTTSIYFYKSGRPSPGLLCCDWQIICLWLSML